VLMPPPKAALRRTSSSRRLQSIPLFDLAIIAVCKSRLPPQTLPSAIDDFFPSSSSDGVVDQEIESYIRFCHFVLLEHRSKCPRRPSRSFASTCHQDTYSCERHRIRRTDGKHTERSSARFFLYVYYSRICPSRSPERITRNHSKESKHHLGTSLRLLSKSRCIISFTAVYRS